MSGRVVEWVLGEDEEDSKKIIIRYDYFYWDENGGRLDKLTSGVEADTDTLQKLKYSYDAVGNLLTIKDYNVGSLQTQTFTYDPIYRLISA